MTQLFAATNIHISLRAEKLFEIGPVSVTNSMLYGLICAIFLGYILVRAARKMQVKPVRGFVQIVEILVEYVITLLEGPLGSRERAAKFTPYFGAFFLFIIGNNMLGLLPIVGPTVTYAGIPLLRPITADLNATIAVSLFAIILVQVLSVREQGGLNHLKHYFSDKPWNPINFFIGILEVFGELTRLTSLSLRLFLNTAVGEILVAVFTSMIIGGGRTPLAVLPIFAFETLVAGIQAYVFTVLAATYLGLATAHSQEHAHSHHDLLLPEDDAPEPARKRTSRGRSSHAS
jgi:F-type H+-transporting ATPase subunit a